MLDLLQELNSSNKYKIYDFSNKTFEQLCKSVGLCHSMNNIIVYVQRNENNTDFFQFHEHINSNDSKSYRPVQFIMYHRDNYIDFTDITYSDEDDKKRKKLMISKNLLENSSCAICFEENVTQTPCRICTTSFCYSCLEKHMKVNKSTNCPLCKQNMDVSLHIQFS